jgi:hypothetical protein
MRAAVCRASAVPRDARDDFEPQIHTKSWDVLRDPLDLGHSSPSPLSHIVRPDFPLAAAGVREDDADGGALWRRYLASLADLSKSSP